MIIILFLIFIIFRYIFNNFFRKREQFVGSLRVANELDKKRALKFALKKMCESKGYSWVEQSDEFTYDCKHTKESCQRSSVYPTKVGDIPKYYEWRDADSKDARASAENAISSLLRNDNKPQTLSQQAGQSTLSESEFDITRDGICIIGNEYFRNMCESNALSYDIRDGSCKTNRTYCANKCLPFCNGDCFETVSSKVNESIFGTTVGRAVACTTLDRAVTELACLASDAAQNRKITI